MKKNVGVILASGKGLRAGTDTPKQFICINGKSVLEHSIDAFERNPHIDSILIVSATEYKERIQASVKKHSFMKVIDILEGGEERYHSSLAAIRRLDGIYCNILIHDAVRPLVSQRIINDIINELKQHNAVNVAIPATDTIVEADRSRQYISRTPDRSSLFLVQTPQGFDRNTLAKAFEIALSDKHFQATDDCSVINKYLPEEKIKIVEGDIYNVKITWPEDFAIAETLLEKFIKKEA